MIRYRVLLEEKLNVLYVSAKNKTQARKKIKNRLANRKANGFVKIYDIDELIY